MVATISNGGGYKSGRIYLLAGAPGDVELVCDAVAHSQGGPAQIQLYGVITEFTSGLEVMIERAIPDSFATVSFGTRQAPVPFGDGVLCIEPHSPEWRGGASTAERIALAVALGLRP